MSAPGSTSPSGEDDKVVDLYLAQFASGRSEDAFFGLIDLPGLLPALCRRLPAESDPRVRTFLLEVIAEAASPDALPVFAAALRDDADDVWQAALDGIVMAAQGATETAMAILRQALESAHGEKAEWIREALEQVADM